MLNRDGRDLLARSVCEGRGAYCLQANDQAWSEVIVGESLCNFCDGTGRVCQPDAAEYDPYMLLPAFPYRDV
jgi:hypothetical protein